MLDTQTTLVSDAGLRCPYCQVPIVLDVRPPVNVRCPSCGGSFCVAATPTETALEGATAFHRFHLLQRAGQGSYGIVWRARDTVLDRLVALKLPNPNLPWNKTQIERVRHEARALAGLRHPGIVTVHEVLDLNGLPVIVADFIAGPSLLEFLKGRALTFAEAVALVCDVAGALQHAHSRGLVHRDVKPGNIMLEPATCNGFDATEEKAPPDLDTPIGRPVLVDFGLALRDEVEVIVTLSGQIVGTPAYMSPEQATGDSSKTDRRSDVYSLGVVLYQLLTGELPFRGSRTMLVHQLLREEPRPPRRINDKIPRDLETICLKAMSKEPRWRYQTAGEFANDLRRFQRGEPVFARPATVLRKTCLWAWRRPAQALLALALVGVFVLVIAGLLREMQHANREKENAKELTAALAESHLSNGLSHFERRDAARGMLWFARALEFASPESQADECRYLRLSVSAWQARECLLTDCFALSVGQAGDGGARRVVGFSADGRSAIAIGTDGTCRIREDGAGEFKKFVLKPAKGLKALALSTCSAIAGYSDGTICTFSIPSGEADSETIRLPGTVTLLAVSHDGGLLLAAGKDREARLFHRGHGQRPPVRLGHGSRIRCAAISPDGELIFTGSDDGTGRVWNIDGKLVRSVAHRAGVTAAAFGDGYALLATGTSDGRLNLWDLSKQEPVEMRSRHSLRVRDMAFSPDGRLLFSADDDNSACVWSVASREQIASPLAHGGAVVGLAVAPDGKRLITNEADRTARIWTVPQLEGHVFEAPARSMVRTVAFDPDDRLMLMAGGESDRSGFVSLVDVKAGRVLSTPLVHSQYVQAAAFNHDGTLVASAGYDGMVRVADTASGAAGPVLRHGSKVYTLGFSPRQDLLLSGGEDSVVRLWDARTGAERGSVAHHGPLNVTAFSPDGERFITATSVERADGGRDGVLCLFRTADLSPVCAPVRSEPVQDAVFSRDGKTILLQCAKEARLFDAQQGFLIGGTPALSARIHAAAFSPDERLILTAGEDGTARLWDSRQGYKQVAAFSHPSPVMVAVFSPDGQLILTGLSDGAATLWDAHTGRSIGPPLRHRGRVMSVAFSHDGRYFATSCSEGAARLWQTPLPLEGQPAAVLERMEILTGMELAGRAEPVLLDPDGWRARRQALEK
jgi:WD40 repeat protein